jgi:hypothetical protein
MTQKRVLEFSVGANIENNIIIGLKTVKIEVEVTDPNEYGVFQIITKIGDETPNIRISSINNKNIVKED